MYAVYNMRQYITHTYCALNCICDISHYIHIYIYVYVWCTCIYVCMHILTRTHTHTQMPIGPTYTYMYMYNVHIHSIFLHTKQFFHGYTFSYTNTDTYTNGRTCKVQGVPRDLRSVRMRCSELSFNMPTLGRQNHTSPALDSMILFEQRPGSV